VSTTHGAEFSTFYIFFLKREVRLLRKKFNFSEKLNFLLAV